MFRKQSIAGYATLLILSFVGAWLTGLFENSDRLKEVSGGELLAAFLGFFILVGALLGIVLLIRRDLTPLTEDQVSEWEHVRRRGRSPYVRAAIIKGFIIGLFALSWPFISDYWKTRSLSLILDSAWIYTAVF